MTAMASFKTSPKWDETNLRAYQDVTDLLNRDRKAHVGWWAYQNGNSKIFTALCKAIKKYSYFHKVNQIIADKKQVIAAELQDTETAILVGAADAVETKELPILLELLKKDTAKLKKVVLIDVSKAFNESAATIVQRELHKINPAIKIQTINSDFLKLDDETIKSLQQGIVSLFMFGGLPFNSPGDVSQGLPRGKITEIFAAVSRILTFGQSPEKNALIMDHKEAGVDINAMEAEYPSLLKADEIDPSHVQDGKIDGVPIQHANFEHFFLNCFSYMLNKIPGFSEVNPHLVSDGKVTPEKLSTFFRHYKKFDETSSNLVNGLENHKQLIINVPRPDSGFDKYTIVPEQGKFVLFNTIYPKEQIIAGWMDDLSNSMGITATHKGPQNGITNVITISRPTAPSSLRAA